MPINSKKFPFSKDNIEKSPDKTGVYALYNGDTLIYVGRAKGDSTTIRSRLSDHKSGREGNCTKSATHYRREVCTNPVSREKELLAEYQTKNGKLPKCNEKMP